jgi:prephenate dehydrogenase
MPDEGPDFFTDKHVAIFGLGLMGGSLAMALQGKCRLLTGIDPNPVAIRAATSRDIVDRAAEKPGSLLNDADLVILATPVNTILKLLADLPTLCCSPAVVLDLGSTKRKICEAMQALPAWFDPIGGHPMCGKETSGLDNADPSIFQRAAFALVTLERTTTAAQETAEALVKIIGSHPLWLSAAEHDQQVAATSHLPFLAANALAYCTPLGAASMAASGFASTTRLAGTSPDMMMDVLQTNGDAILNSLQHYREHLEVIEYLLSSGDLPQLRAILTAGAENRMRIDMSIRGEIL